MRFTTILLSTTTLTPLAPSWQRHRRKRLHRPNLPLRRRRFHWRSIVPGTNYTETLHYDPPRAASRSRLRAQRTAWTTAAADQFPVLAEGQPGLWFG